MNTYEKEHLARLRPYLAECTVLLKKDGSFPLESVGRIAAYGSGVRHTLKGGTGSGEVNSRYFVTVEQGLRDAGFEITTWEWLDGYDRIRKEAHEDFIKDIKRQAKEKHTQAVLLGMGAVMPEPEYTLPLDGEGDTAIYVLSRICGEGNDRRVVPGDFMLSETEQRDILELNRKYDKFMLVLNVGGPVDLTPVLEVKNILVLSQLGVETGSILADLLLGKAYPSGKLSSTWAEIENYSDVGTFGDINNTFYKEGIYVGYRWFDASGKKALFPFGYGLGYTSFSIENIDVTIDRSTVTLTCSVTNTGDFRGKETVQIYLSAPEGKLDKPVKELVAFAKTKELDPGECERIQLAFDLRDASSYDEELAAYILEGGDYYVSAGNTSQDVEAVCILRLDKTVVTRKVKNLFPMEEFEDWKSEKKTEFNTNDILVLPVSASDIDTEIIDYDIEEKIEDVIDEMTGDELCLMNMGAFDPKGGMASVIGSASLSVAGAAGETTGQFTDRNIPVLVMSDGPAGVRISPQYYTDQKGIHSFGPSMPVTLLEYMPKMVQLIMGRTPKVPKGAEVKEQYCTAIPVGTALAQSFNTEFAKMCGDVVGSEMERFGIKLWLAPSLNIHRSPLCGRNFEYYSEDPFVSGIMAASVVSGIQQHKNRGAVIKHFAANNQETNRYFTNSVMSERALREIYLKGFEICIRKSKPMAVMTSYNLINGTHTSESRALCTDILRREFRFDGICMTDWVVQGLGPAEGSQYTVPDPATVAAAGGDLFMPGSKKDQENLKQGFKAGRVTKQQLKMNASKVCRVARFLNEG